jgi:hypothetical protein
MALAMKEIEEQKDEITFLKGVLQSNGIVITTKEDDETDK